MGIIGLLLGWLVATRACKQDKPIIERVELAGQVVAVSGEYDKRSGTYGGSTFITVAHQYGTNRFRAISPSGDEEVPVPLTASEIRRLSRFYGSAEDHLAIADASVRIEKTRVRIREFPILRGGKITDIIYSWPIDKIEYEMSEPEKQRMTQ